MSIPDLYCLHKGMTEVVWTRPTWRVTTCKSPRLLVSVAHENRIISASLFEGSQCRASRHSQPNRTGSRQPPCTHYTLTGSHSGAEPSSAGTAADLSFPASEISHAIFLGLSGVLGHSPGTLTSKSLEVWTVLMVARLQLAVEPRPFVIGLAGPHVRSSPYSPQRQPSVASGRPDLASRAYSGSNERICCQVEQRSPTLLDLLTDHFSGKKWASCPTVSASCAFDFPRSG